MKNCELNTFATSDELTTAAATAWLRLVQAAAGSPAQCVALSGGRLTGKLFSAITEQSWRNGVALGSVHFFWADERCVPPDDSESNFRIAQELLFGPLRIDARHIHRIRGEARPELAAAEVEAELRQIAPPDPTGQPVLDLVFLGMGEDGHVASLFPGESESETRSPQVYRPVVALKPPPRRITLGYASLATARQVWVLVSGPGKEAALEQSLSPGDRTPLARVLRVRRHTKVFSDVRIQRAEAGGMPGRE
jgi:6-phosphogluconolactonase